MKFAHNFSETPIDVSKPEQNDGKSLVESAGYISAQKRIENMILAGQRLSDYRKSSYDFKPGQEIDDNFFDPTRKGNYDLADAFQDSLNLEGRLKASQTAPEPLKEAQNDDKGVSIPE